MKPVAALAALVLLLLVGPIAGPASASPSPPAPLLRLDVEELGPRVVTSDGPAVLSVVGTVTNTGDAPVSGLAIRVQRGEPLTTEGEVRDALRGSGAADGAVPQFVDLPGELAPGASIPVRLAVSLRAPSGLALSRTGVYELLLNVNGTPDGGERARLAAMRVLLPVVSLPPVEGAVPSPAPRASSPVPFTLLYPIADVPHRLGTVPGEPAQLVDDELATSLAPGGRLYGLVDAVAERAPTGSPARAATCVAVDADLVATAAAMREGYEVRRPDGTRVPGTGAEAAGRWLDLLATTARGGCLLALPYADADVVALARGGLADLAGQSLTDGRTVLSDVLGVSVLPDTSWPVDGVLDERALAAVAAQGRAVVLSADGLAGPDRVTGVLPVAGDRPQLAVLADPLLTSAASGPTGGPVPDTPGVRPATIPAGTTTPLSTQDAIGTLTFRARTVEAETDPLVLAPPHQWAAEGTGAGALLTAVDQLVRAGLLAPRPLSEVAGSGIPATGAQRLDYPLRAGAREIPPEVVATVAGTRSALADLRSATVEQGSVGIGVDDVFEPLTRGLVRAASGAFRGRADEATQAAAAQDGRIEELRAAVRVLEPPSPYALGSQDAPLQLTVANGLPVGIRVDIELASSGGLRVDPIPEQVVPPLGRRQVQVNAEVTRSGQFTVDAVVRTPDGEQLGPASRLRVRSTGYGTITVWLTGTAGVLLVVLAARRVLRRVRGEIRSPGPPPLPEPEDPTTTRLPSFPPVEAGAPRNGAPAPEDLPTRPLPPPVADGPPSRRPPAPPGLPSRPR